MTSCIDFSGILSSSSSYSSSLTSQWTYDVFLSFRGEDTRNNFTAHLYDALRQKGIHTFIDDDLRRGEKISPAILKAIEESRISIIIFSENYASSTYCLEELMKILDCQELKQQKVLPVFYKVEPSIVRHQKKSFGEALTKHEDRFKDDAKVQSWKTALKQAAELCGLHLEINGNESIFISKIVQEVSRMVPKHTSLHFDMDPVGMESRVNDISMLLRINTNDTYMIGIFGTGGIGKTTIAKVMYNLIADQFEGTCFLENVRESSKPDKGGLIQLQEKILSEILRYSSLKVFHVDQGINLIKERLCRKKVLLVIDDVDRSDQLEKLCGRCDWFGLGSLIIITTRDKDLLVKHSVGLKYRMKEMDHDEALKLFSRYAFKSDKPNNDFKEVIELALYYAGGLPLALKVVGSNLYGKDRHYWESEMKKYKRIPEENIQEILKISYDGLDYYAQKIFLDIACFFKGDKREYVNQILESCDLFSYAGIQKLNYKCLITIDRNGRLRMHDLLEDMGREIIRQESPEEPGKRSRLCFHKDVREVLEKNKGTEQIEGILIDLPRGDHMIHLSPNVFANMERLRIFINRNASFSGELNYLSNELRVLDWPKYPFQSLPSNFHGEKLLILRMNGSMIREIGERLLSKNLTSISFRECEYLTKISDLSSCSNLKGLILDGCKSLVEVHDSVGFLEWLIKLSFKGCSGLKNLPRSFKLKFLKLLELGGCTSLENFPEIGCEMEYLNCVQLHSTVIQEIPSSISRYLIGLKRLSMDGCKSLVRIPICIFQLEHLEEVDVINCPDFVNFGNEVGHNTGQSMPCTRSTQENEISSSLELPSTMTSSSISTDQDFFLSTSCRKSNFSSSLRNLNLSNSGIVSLPQCIKEFVGLCQLDLENCKQLEEILHLPPNIEAVNARGCVSLKRFPLVSAKYCFGAPELKRLRWIDFSDSKVHVNVGKHGPSPFMIKRHFREKESSCIIYPGSRIPEWFKYCKETTPYSNSCEIEIDHEASMCGHHIVALVLCFVVGPIPVGLETITISINGQSIRHDMWLSPSMDPRRVWLQCITANSIEILSTSSREGNNLRFTFGSYSKEAIFRSVGVHLICRNNNCIDHPIQPSKRYRDDADNDLELELNPKLNRPQSSTSSIMELKDGVHLKRPLSSTSSIMEFKDANDDLDLNLPIMLFKDANDDLDLELAIMEFKDAEDELINDDLDLELRLGCGRNQSWERTVSVTEFKGLHIIPPFAQKQTTWSWPTSHEAGESSSRQVARPSWMETLLSEMDSRMDEHVAPMRRQLEDIASRVKNTDIQLQDLQSAFNENVPKPTDD